MTKKILEICIGTPCYLMGASELIEYYNNLESRIKDKIELRTSHCLEDKCEKGPVIKFDDKLYFDVTPERLSKIIRKKTQ
ncbi:MULTISPECIES: NAD(P)H-dependent oxidoreductase subunit E [unclassified Halanaerobium]|uniref:NAD(P)H-dependent oxidoreductase subunit E n=1 Tax=unclassified Halanaerobium TaxID=2641197 RepID=UPI000DF2D577|nr:MULTISPECIES: NAD(P)H-dependent oxidoreductase subunit E [unclassified Halanaerobium]RCW49218.1 thioredoxin-like protein [Halanaerobium sp. MA284_MarDTE_T2]RCW82951.1 thioredoxin-like protein [Halanaerobium sp. DL-01]